MERQLNFRPARPGDVEQAVPLIYSSGPAAFDYIFFHPKRGSAQDFLSYVFTQGHGEMGYANHTIVELDGRVAGIGAVWSGRETLRFTLSIAWNILKFYGLRAAIGVGIRGLRFEQMVRPPARREAVLAHIGVAREFQGRGLGRKLMEYLMKKAASLPVQQAVLDVSVLNDRAIRLYERLGFEVTSTTDRHLQRSGNIVPGHHRMSVSLRD